MLKSALIFKAGKAAYDKFNQSRGGTRGGSTRPGQTRRAGNRNRGGTLGRLAKSVLGRRR
ncbi:MAG: hypothetical protein WD378_09980 [Egicoccus sp.]